MILKTLFSAPEEYTSRQLALLAQPMRRALALQLCCLLLVEITFFTTESPRWLGYWGAALAASFTYLYWLQREYQRHASNREDLYWQRRFTLGNGLSALLWGSAAARLLSADAQPLLLLSGAQALVLLIVPTLAVAALYFFACHRATLRTYVLLLLLPPAAAVITNGTLLTTGLGLVFLALLMITLLAGRQIDHLYQQSATLTANNKTLLTQLGKEKQQAAAAAKKAQDVNIAKSKFLAATSHDLRQPLHAMGLLLYSLKAMLEREPQKVLLSQVEQSHKTMEQLFNALLDVSKLDAGVVETHIQSLSLPDIFSHLRDELTPMASNKGLTLTVEPIEGWVNSDPVLLPRVIRNLIHNAIVHSDSGWVAVTARENPHSITISVADTGPGIPEEERTTIFAEFHQLRNPERDRNKGLGLGLAIVSRLCGLLGHDLSFDSTVGEGSTFSIRVAKAGSAPVKLNSRVSSLEGGTTSKELKILVVDDETSILNAMERLIAGWGYQPAIASSQASALDIIGRGFNPDFAICDFRLQNNVTGVDVLKLINTRLGRKLPALLVTGDTAPERIQEAHASGYALLHKPIKPAKLRTAINRIMRASQQ